MKIGVPHKPQNQNPQYKKILIFTQKMENSKINERMNQKLWIWGIFFNGNFVMGILGYYVVQPVKSSFALLHILVMNLHRIQCNPFHIL